MQLGTIYKADGTTERIKPANGGSFALPELQRAVGGFIEHVRMAPGNGHAIMLINEEGKLRGLPYNALASALIDPDLSEYVVGDALIITSE